MFNQAICEHINPDYTCNFTQMISAGDPICSWVIEKKKK
jgi:predicted hydrocarbon binding protein